MSSKYAFAKALKEVRFLFCHTGEGSAATRTFLTKAYPTMKKNNPYTPILMREAAGTLPKVYARYGPSFIIIIFYSSDDKLLIAPW
ncbi:hypothetical protein GGS23DRAFT_592723 [Durotheca rogersii]|uniref:uncharacterized protein n=1 Tax=Durotheca rogersii TaxID=419775 RepID=UPI00221F4254|nr:uncharacterized protein GGS23DRAFT_592723 [Durotheca rogersii]KAI5867407.1 hypothetical protein GGS23DRAFT_592723 [Durotheca rogersii]